MDYIRKHWRGELSLAVSFWINLVLLNIITKLVTTRFLASGIVENEIFAARAVLIYMVFYCIIIFPWQIVGLWRASNHHIDITDRYFWARIAQVIVVIRLIFLVSFFNSYWPVYKNCFRSFEEDEYRNYAVTLEKDKTLIHLQGDLKFGVSREVAKLLKKNHEVTGIILDTNGGKAYDKGSAYEGRKLAKLISAYGINTYSLKGGCSATTIAFITGKKRFMGTGAHLAFHEPQLDSRGRNKISEIEEELDKALLAFQKQGVKTEFLEKMSTAFHSNDFWYPSVDELLDARVIHGVVEPSGFESKDIPAYTSR